MSARIPRPLGGGGIDDTLDDALYMPPPQQQLDDAQVAFDDDVLVAAPTKRARTTIELPECAVCLDLAVPPCVLDCDHMLCGPCVRALERPRPVRSARFTCPQCRARVLTYTVPTFLREASYQAGTDEQRAAADAFLREYRGGQRAPAPPSAADAANRRLLTVIRAIPRRLTAPEWHHNGTQWTVHIRNAFAFYESLGFRSGDMNSLKRRLRTRLRRGGLTLQCNGTEAIISLQVTDVAKFDHMQWPDAAPAVIDRP